MLSEVSSLFAGDQQRHRITLVCPSDLPQVRGDENRLHQVLTNLLSNACKYSPHGTRIEVGSRATADELLIWVKDEGMGVPEEAREKVFDKFYRIDNSDSRKIGGTGLSLALVKEIVEAHGGRVWVESSPGCGSTFWVALPLGGET
jgi:signal transduction histidine kinase